MPTKGIEMDSQQPPTATLVTSRDDLVDAVLEVAAEAGVSVSVTTSISALTPDTGHLGRLLLVGPDAGDLAGADHVCARTVVVSLGDSGDPPSEQVWRTARVWQADQVVVLPAGRGWLRSAFMAGRCGDPEDADITSGGIADDGLVLAVVPGHGGAGASVLSAALGLVAAGRGMRCLLVDADPLGGGADLLVSADSTPGARWLEVASMAPQLRPDDLLSILPQAGGLSVLSHQRPPASPLHQPDEDEVIAKARAAFDLVVVDCPGAPRYPEWVSRADAAVLVCGADVRATAAANGPASWLRDRAIPRDLVVRTQGRVGLRPRDIGDILGIPLTAQLRSQREVTVAIEDGRLAEVVRTGSMAGVVETLLRRAAFGDSAAA